MERMVEYMDFFSFLWEKGKGPLVLVGIGVLTANLLWLLVQLFYGEVLVYSLKEEKQYCYMGSLWMERQAGEYTLIIPKRILGRACTTQYKLCIGRGFLKLHEGKMLCIQFGKEYQTFLPLAEEMLVKNHVATSSKL